MNQAAQAFSPNGQAGYDAGNAGSQSSRSTFGKYTLLRKLASGGMGEVFLAKQRGPSGFEKLLVIKRILSHHLDKRDYLDMFFSEAKLVARLNHNNIIQIHEMGEIDGDYYIAMEYVRGKSLRDIVDALRAEGRVLPLAHVVDLAIKLCEGLGYAHQARDIRGRPLSIVHRDINPHNILVTYNGDLKLIDFGIAKSEMTSVHTATGTIKGKFVYMSPEQSAADPIDRRSDIFSLGIVLYEMTALENPFVRQNVVLSLEAIQRQAIVPPSVKRSDATPLDAILGRALEKRVEDRYQTAIEMRDELRNLFRTGEVTPAAEDISTFLSHLFAQDVEEEDRLLAEADRATAAAVPGPDPSPRGTELSLSKASEAGAAPSDGAPSSPEAFEAPVIRPAIFADEEPTLSGDHVGLALGSRRGASERAALALPAHEGRLSVSAERQEIAPPAFGRAEVFVSDVEIPTRSDRIPDIARRAAQAEMAANAGGRAAYAQNSPQKVAAAFEESASLSGRLSALLEPPPDARFGGDSKGSLRDAPSTPVGSRPRAVARRYPAWRRSVLLATGTLVFLGAVLAGYFGMIRVTRSGSSSSRTAVVPGASDLRPIAPLEPMGVAHSAPDLGSSDPRSEMAPPLPSPDPRPSTDGRAATAPMGEAAVVSNDDRVEDAPEPLRKLRKAKKRGPPRDVPRAADRTESDRHESEPRPSEGAQPHGDESHGDEPEGPRDEKGSIRRVDSSGSSEESASNDTVSVAAGLDKPGTETALVLPDETRAPAAARLGTLTLSTSSEIAVEFNGTSVGSSPTSIAVRSKDGEIKLAGENAEFSVTIQYEVDSGGITVRVGAEPWAIVQHNGISLGKTPKGPVESSRRHHLSLLRPGQREPFKISLLWTPKSP